MSWFQDQRAGAPGNQYTTRHGIHVAGTLIGFPLPSFLTIFYNQILHFKTNRHREHEACWITWSDCYWLFSKDERKDAPRAEQILQEGLATPGVEDRLHILERSLNLYEQTGKDRESVGVREELEQARKTKTATKARFTPDLQAMIPLAFNNSETQLARSGQRSKRDRTSFSR